MHYKPVQIIDPKWLQRIMVLLTIVLLIIVVADSGGCSDVPDWEQRAPGVSMLTIVALVTSTLAFGTVFIYLVQRE